MSQPPFYKARHHRQCLDIHSQLLKCIINMPQGRVKFDYLLEKIPSFSVSEIWSYICNHENNFVVQRPFQYGKYRGKPNGSEVIYVKTDLRLCEKFCRKARYCSGECHQLHLCRNFLLQGNMHCSFYKSGKICAFGHDLQTRHNSNLLKSCRLDFLSEFELRNLFKLRICRSMSTMPQICIYYNGKGGKVCSNKRCKSLHLCLDFVLGYCQSKRCEKNHSMSTSQVTAVLDLFAIDQSWSNKSIREDLQSIMKNRVSQRCDDDEDNDTCSVFSIDSRPARRMDDFEESESEEKKFQSDDEMAGSQTNLKGLVVVDDTEDIDVDDNNKYNCCSHCKETRADMAKMEETIKALEKELTKLKTVCDKFEANNQSSNQADKKNSDTLGSDHVDTDNLKTALKDIIFQAVSRVQPEHVKEITDILLLKDKVTLINIMSSEEALQTEVEDALLLI